MSAEHQQLATESSTGSRPTSSSLRVAGDNIVASSHDLTAAAMVNGHNGDSFGFTTTESLSNIQRPSHNNGGGIAQQVLQQQASLAIAQRQQFMKQVGGMNQLFQAQELSIAQSNEQLQKLLIAIQPLLTNNPQLRDHAAKAQRSQAQSASLHQMLHKSLAKLQEGQVRAQDQQLKQSQDQMSGMLEMMQAQANQLSQTQQQVGELQRFAKQAQLAVEESTRMNNERLHQTQEQMNALQRQLSEQQVVQQQQARVAAHQATAQTVPSVQSILKEVESDDEFLPEGQSTMSAISAERGTLAAMSLRDKPSEIERRLEELTAELRGLLDLADEAEEDVEGFEEEWV
mmetsp:Transcript_54261/g.129339  ORF Transcript_54261/g.129339 Transcript_54261/m.129339 type:complete len:344 (-) Transcript_54261:150-1181(-)